MSRNVYILIFAGMILASCTNFLNVKPQGKVLPQTDEEFAAIMHNRINDIEGGYDEYVLSLSMERQSVQLPMPRVDLESRRFLQMPRKSS